jgi:hypothetical protein
MERNMAFKVQVGPPQISIHQGQTILITELDGQINWPSDKGLSDRKAFMPAAGLPWFVAPFGRDALIVSLQNIFIYRHLARGALEFLGCLQATDDDPYRDAEPAKRHDNAIIALGFKRYGFNAEAAQIAHDISKAASHFQLNQLPELYTAFQRDETTFAVQYIGANVPQARAAGSAFMLTQAMLGFMPDASNNKLYVDPSLPSWLPDLTIQDIRLGHHTLTIRFWLAAGETHFEVLNGDPNVVERRQFQSNFAAWTETADALHQNQI